MKILCPCPQLFSKEALDYLSSKTNLECKKISQKKFEVYAPKFDALLIRFDVNISEKIIGNHSKIKSIICPTTGLDHINLNLCKKYGINIFCLKGKKKFLQNITATAELTIALLLTIARNTHIATKSVLNYNWDQEKFRGIELKDKIIGIIGFGRLGSIVAKICNSLSMKVFYYDTNKKVQSTKFAKKKSLNYILTKSDFISIHIPLEKKNIGFISKKEFKKMKKNVIIINTSRGKIIKDNDLLEALKKNHISGAALDVLSDENKSNLKQNKMIKYAKKNNNLLITPHIGGATQESIIKTDFFVINEFLKKNNIN